MTKWCGIEFNVSGLSGDIKKFQSDMELSIKRYCDPRAGVMYNDPDFPPKFTFNCAIAIPDRLEIIASEWCSIYWGTKCDACHSQKTLINIKGAELDPTMVDREFGQIRLRRQSIIQLLYAFDTASPPIPCLHAFAQKYASLSFHISYFLEEEGFNTEHKIFGDSSLLKESQDCAKESIEQIKNTWLDS